MLGLYQNLSLIMVWVTADEILASCAKGVSLPRRYVKDCKNCPGDYICFRKVMFIRNLHLHGTLAKFESIEDPVL